MNANEQMMDIYNDDNYWYELESTQSEQEAEQDDILPF